MKVDQRRLGEIIRKVNTNEQNFEFAVGEQLVNENILPVLNVEGIGNIPVPIAIKNINRLKKASDGVHYCKDSGSKAKKTLTWQMNANNIIRHEEVTEIFFRKTLPSLISDSLRKMGFSDSEVLKIEARPLALLISERGSVRPLLSDFEQEGMLGTFFLQIPVKNGYKGGTLKVRHRGETRDFDHSNDSKKSFYSTVFFSGCEHELSEVTHGWRLVLTFSLCWKWIPSLFMPLPADNSIILAAAKELHNILSVWQVPDSDHQRMLAIPLENAYTTAGLSFAGLKGRDRFIASLFSSIDFMDLQLASVRRMKKSTTNSPSNNAEQISEDQQEYYVECWFSAQTNSSFAFLGLEIDFDSELVLPMLPLANTESIKFANQTESYTTTSNYHDAVLVIWPKRSTIDLACRYGFVGALDLLEFLATNMPKENVLFVLGRAMAFCCANPGFIWGPSCPSPIGQVTNRLLQVCIKLESSSQGLILLNLMATDFPAAGSASMQFEGIKTVSVAINLARFIRMTGWNDCEEGVLSLMSSPYRIEAQMTSLCTLVSSLSDLGLLHIAIQIADRICPILFSSPFASKFPTIVKTAEMVFNLEQWANSNNEERVKSFIKFVPSIETVDLCHVITHVQKYFFKPIKQVSEMKKFYHELCKFLVNRNLFNALPVSSHGVVIIDILICLLWLDVWEILKEFVKQVTHPRQGNNVCLEFLVYGASSEAVWKACNRSENGKKALQILVDCRIRELHFLRPPPTPFNWEQNAVIPKYPELEAFLRSDQLSTTFPRKFPSFSDASEFAVENFGSGYTCPYSNSSPFFKDHQYSATVQFKKVGGGMVVCIITKNRRFFEYSLREFELRKQELTDLLKRRHSNELTDDIRPPHPKRNKFNSN